MLITILAGVFILSIVIVVHEFGHFIVAKKLGIFVKVFSIGFGRKILKKRIGETVYAISALPFGGYVKFAGETEERRGEGSAAGKDDATRFRTARSIPDGTSSTSARSFASAVVFAGPFSNYVLAVLIYVVMFTIIGLPVQPETTTIGSMDRGSPADSVGLMVDDTILASAETRWRTGTM